MNFRFKLASVLKVRTYEVKLEKQKLSLLLRQQSDLESRYRNHMKKIRLAASEKGKDPVNGQNRERMFQNYLLIESRALHRLKATITAKRKEVTAQQKRVIEANRKLQTLEKLKVKALMEFHSEQNRKEQIFQNEIATQMFHRQQLQ